MILLAPTVAKPPGRIGHVWTGQGTGAGSALPSRAGRSITSAGSPPRRCSGHGTRTDAQGHELTQIRLRYEDGSRKGMPGELVKQDLYRHYSTLPFS